MKTSIAKLLFFSFMSLFSVHLVNAQTATVTIDQDRDIDRLLEYKKDLKTVDFYKIQIYSSPDRAQADKILGEFRASFPFTNEKVYDTPNYKVQVGNFRTRLEADRALRQIKKKFSSAFIFKPKGD